MRELKAFVGFQTKSDFQTQDELESALQSLTGALREAHDVSLQVTYGVFPPGTILWDELTESLSSTDIALFDISENNPNVMMEVGLAYGFGKQVYALKNNESSDRYKKPADLAAIYVPYDRGDLTSGGITETLVTGVVTYLQETHPPDFYLKSFWGFAEHDDVLIVCSELGDPEERQHPEENEYLYLSKYGDVDSLVEVLVTLHRLYPHMRISYKSSGEATAAGGQDYSGNLVLVGGPDYNEITGMFDEFSPFEYFQHGEAEEDIALREKANGQTYEPKFADGSGQSANIDYGFLVKLKNPHNPDKRLIMLGGAHAPGVLGAVKAFSYRVQEKGVSYHNCRAIVERFGDNPCFAALFEVRAVGFDVQTPRVADAVVLDV